MPAKRSPRIVTNPFKNKNIGRRTGKDVKAGKVIRKTEGGFENFDDYWSESDADLTKDGTFIKPGMPAKPAASRGECSSENRAHPEIQPAVQKQQEASQVPAGTVVTQPSVLSQLQAGNVDMVKGAINPFRNRNIGHRTGMDIKAGKTIGILQGGFENFDDYWSETEASFSNSTISGRSFAARPTAVPANNAHESVSRLSQNDKQEHSADSSSTKENKEVPEIGTEECSSESQETETETEEDSSDSQKTLVGSNSEENSREKETSGNRQADQHDKAVTETERPDSNEKDASEVVDEVSNEQPSAGTTTFVEQEDSETVASSDAPVKTQSTADSQESTVEESEAVVSSETTVPAQSATDSQESPAEESSTADVETQSCVSTSTVQLSSNTTQHSHGEAQSTSLHQSEKEEGAQQLSIRPDKKASDTDTVATTSDRDGIEIFSENSELAETSSKTSQLPAQKLSVVQECSSEENLLLDEEGGRDKERKERTQVEERKRKTQDEEKAGSSVDTEEAAKTQPKDVATKPAEVPEEVTETHQKQNAVVPAQPVTNNGAVSTSRAALSQINSLASPDILSQKSSVYVSIAGDVTGSITCQDEKTSPQPRLFGTRKRLSYSYAVSPNDEDQPRKQEKPAKSRLPREPPIPEHHQEDEQKSSQPLSQMLSQSQSRSGSEAGLFVSLASKPANQNNTQATVAHSVFSDDDEGDEFEIIDDSWVYSSKMKKDSKPKGTTQRKRATSKYPQTSQASPKPSDDAVQGHSSDEQEKKTKQTKAKTVKSKPGLPSSNISPSSAVPAEEGEKLEHGKSRKRGKIMESASRHSEKEKKSKSARKSAKGKASEIESENTEPEPAENQKVNSPPLAEKPTGKGTKKKKTAHSDLEENLPEIEMLRDAQSAHQSTKRRLQKGKHVNVETETEEDKDIEEEVEAAVGKTSQKGYAENEKAVRKDVQPKKKVGNRRRHDTGEKEETSKSSTTREMPKQRKRVVRKAKQAVSPTAAAETHESDDEQLNGDQVEEGFNPSAPASASCHLTRSTRRSRRGHEAEDEPHSHDTLQAETNTKGRGGQTGKRKSRRISRQNAREESDEPQQSESIAPSVSPERPQRSRSKKRSEKQALEVAHPSKGEPPSESDTGVVTTEKRKRGRTRKTSEQQTADNDEPVTGTDTAPTTKLKRGRLKKRTSETLTDTGVSEIPVSATSVATGLQDTDEHSPGKQQRRSTSQDNARKQEGTENDDQGGRRKRTKPRKASQQPKESPETAPAPSAPAQVSPQVDQRDSATPAGANGAAEELCTPATPYLSKIEVGDSALKSGISFRRISHLPTSDRAKRSKKQLSVGSGYKISPDDIATPPLCKQPRISSPSSDTPLARPQNYKGRQRLSSCLAQPRLSDGTPHDKDSRRVTISNVVTQHDLSSPGSSGEADTVLPSMTATPVHYFHVTSPATEPPGVGLDKNKIIVPEHHSEVGLRRSQRTRVKRLEWYKNERIVYDRRKSGPVIVAVQPSREKLYLEQEEMKRRKRRQLYLARKKRQQTRGPMARRLSAQVPVPEDVHLTPRSEVTVLHPHTKEIVHLGNLFQPRILGNSDWPGGDDPIPGDPYTIKLQTQQRLFTTGVVTLAPAAEKPLQRAVSTVVVFVVTFGKVLVTINTVSQVVETGDHFFVPGGTVYKLKNLRHEEAVLTFTNLMLDIEEQPDEMQDVKQDDEQVSENDDDSP